MLNSATCGRERVCCRSSPARPTIASRTRLGMGPAAVAGASPFAARSRVTPIQLVRRSAVLGLFACLAALASPTEGPAKTAGSAAAESPAIIYGYGYRPSKVCPTNRTCFTSLRWDRWSRSMAVGRGKAKTCSPGGTDCVTATTSIRYDRPRRRCGRLSFTRARFRFPDGPLVTARLTALTSSICLWQG